MLDEPEEKVLVVDDDPVNLYAFNAMLEHLHVNHVNVSSGKEALNLLEYDRHFSMIFVDLIMPAVDGFETINRIRNKGIKIPLIPVSARWDLINKAEQHAIPGPFIRKPLSVEQVQHCIHTYYPSGLN